MAASFALFSTYILGDAVNVPGNTEIRLEFANINDPLYPSANYKVTVTNRDAAKTIKDRPGRYGTLVTSTNLERYQ